MTRRIDSMQAYRHIYLSPHYDDAALSCGGTIHQQARAGRVVLVMTIFAEPPGPDAPLSPLARDIHAHMARPGAPDDVILARREEDRAAMAVLGARAVWLPFRDCIYRYSQVAPDGYYRTMDQIFGELAGAERSLARDIAGAVVARLSDPRDTAIHAPLGVGHHVDHQIANQVGWLLAHRGWRVSFYEDFPYSEPGYVQPVAGVNTYSLARTVARQPGTLHPMPSLLSDADIAARIRGVLAYESQLDLVFGDPATVAQRITAHALRHGGPQPRETFWVVRDGDDPMP